MSLLLMSIVSASSDPDHHRFSQSIRELSNKFVNVQFKGITVRSGERVWGKSTTTTKTVASTTISNDGHRMRVVHHAETESTTIEDGRSTDSKSSNELDVCDTGKWLLRGGLLQLPGADRSSWMASGHRSGPADLPVKEGYLFRTELSSVYCRNGMTRRLSCGDVIERNGGKATITKSTHAGRHVLSLSDAASLIEIEIESTQPWLLRKIKHYGKPEVFTEADRKGPWGEMIDTEHSQSFDDYDIRDDILIPCTVKSFGTSRVTTQTSTGQATTTITEYKRRNDWIDADFALNVPEGTKVHLFDDPNIKYEYRNGDIVKVVDQHLVESWGPLTFHGPKWRIGAFLFYLVNVVGVCCIGLWLYRRRQVK